MLLTVKGTAPVVPGPRSVPFLGARANFMAFVVDAPRTLRTLHRRYGDIAALARGGTDNVFVFSPAYNKLVLTDTDLFHNLDASSSPVRMRAGSSLSRLYAGLTNMNGARHRRLRRVMGGALHPRDVGGYAGDILTLADRHLTRRRAGETVDMLAEMRALTLAVAVKTLLGLEPDQAAGRRMSRLLRDWMAAVFSVPALAAPLDLPGLPYHRLTTLSDRLEAAIGDIIARRADGTGESDGTGERDDVLSRLIRAGLHGDELIGETAFLFMAGHATTASALTWTLFLLGAHPRVLEDVIEEVAAGPEPDGDLRLPLLERVIKESLRLLPPVMWWGRVSTAPFDIGPYRLPAGAHVAFSPFITQRRPELYPEPDRFRPDRWLTADPGPYEYLPFSAGPRACLGSVFAAMEVKLVLCLLLRRWRPALTDRPVRRGGLMVSQPKGGLPMTIHPVRDRPPAPRVRGNIRELLAALPA